MIVDECLRLEEFTALKTRPTIWDPIFSEDGSALRCATSTQHNVDDEV